MTGLGPDLRSYSPEDGGGVIDVVATVFDEYRMTFDLHGWDADLKDVEGQYAARGGAFWVLRAGGQVVGTVGVVPRPPEVCELKRLYLLPSHRGRGHGRRLVEQVIHWATGRSYRAVIAWSDVRLETAHQVYRRLGFRPIGERTIDDPDRSHELGFELPLPLP
jgi:putative acetyltransferase